MTAGLTPFDLQPPARLLVPGPAHKRFGEHERSLKLGTGDGAAVFEVTTWKGCQAFCPGQGEHGPGQWVRLVVPCEALPHCHYCECDSDHRFTLTGEMAAGLKAMLP